MLAMLLPMLPSLLLKGVNSYLGYRGQMATDEKKLKVEAQRDQINGLLESRRIDADIHKAAMKFKIFWVPWAIAAVPLSAWFGWGCLDSMVANGSVLPDVAELPPQIKEYADTVWSYLFPSGAAVGSIQTVGNAVIRAVEGRKR